MPTLLLVILGILFIIPIILGIFRVNRAPRNAEANNGSQTCQGTRYLYATLSIIAAFGLGILASYYGYNYLNLNFALPFWVNCGLTFIITTIVLAICGVAINFVTTATNKNLAYAVILTSFLCLGTSGVITQFRGDNFDPKTGACRLWITPSTGKIWRDKPANTIFDPTTGEKIIKATPQILKQLRQRQARTKQPAKTWKTVFAKEFVGVGFTGGVDGKGGIETAEFGKDIQIGDKIFVEKNNSTEVWDRGMWRKYHAPIINRTGHNDYFGVRDKKNFKFKVIVKRLIEN